MQKFSYPAQGNSFSINHCILMECYQFNHTSTKNQNCNIIHIQSPSRKVAGTEGKGEQRRDKHITQMLQFLLYKTKFTFLASFFHWTWMFHVPPLFQLACWLTKLFACSSVCFCLNLTNKGCKYLVVLHLLNSYCFNWPLWCKTVATQQIPRFQRQSPSPHCVKSANFWG